MLSAALMPVASHAQETMSLSQIAKIEKERRVARIQGVDKMIEEAREAYQKNDFQTAVDTYTQALGLLPAGRIVDERRDFLTKSLAQASVELSKTQVRNGDVSGARETLTEILKVDPTNSAAEEQLDMSFDPIRMNDAATKKHAVKVDQVRRHLYKGEGFYNLGLYDEALKEFNKALRIDSYNSAARRWQTKIHAERSQYYESAYDEARTRLLAEVDKAWEIVPRPVAPVISRNAEGGGPEEEPGVILNQRKLENIIIPRLDLEGATLEAAIAQ